MCDVVRWFLGLSRMCWDMGDWVGGMEGGFGAWVGRFRSWVDRFWDLSGLGGLVLNLG